MKTLKTPGNRRQESEPPLAAGVIHVAIIEDAERTLQAMRILIEGTAGFACVGAFLTAEEALQALPALRPEVVLVDINLPGMSGIDLIRRIRGELASTRFMVLTVFEDHDRIFEALRAGAGGYLLKKTSPAGLLEAIRELHSGGAPMSAPIAAQVVAAFQEPAVGAKSDSAASKLSPREAEVLSLLNKGLMYKEIAGRLGISDHTVRSHIARIYHKLQVRSRAQAMLKMKSR